MTAWKCPYGMPEPQTD